MVSTYEEERAAIQDRFNNFFVNAVVPVQYDNLEFLKFSDRTIDDESEVDSWVRHSIINSDAQQVEISGGRDRQFGQIIINVFVRENLGSSAARKIADKIYSIYNRADFEGITCRSTISNPVPPNNGWYQINMVTLYQWDRCVC